MIVEQLKQDFRLAGRGLWRARGFTVAAVFTLTLGIAGTTVMFALIQGVLLRPLPVRDQDRVVVAWKELRSSGFAHYPFGGPDVEAAADAAQLLESCAGVTSNGAMPWIAVEGGVASYVNGALVTGSFFEVLGVEPVLGRSLTRADDVDGAENVLVISYGLWQRRYGGSPDAIGRRVRLAGDPFTVVGVMPRDVDYPRGVEIWRTVRSVPAGGTFGDAARDEVDLIARMRPGVTIEQATGELQALTARLAAGAPPDVPRDLRPVVRSIEDVIVGDTRAALLTLFAAVGLVLLISSANAANLFLMRSEARRRELALCAALGAGRGRIVSLILAESLLLALAAGIAGLGLAYVSLGTVTTVIPNELPRVESVRIDALVALFATGVALVTALLAGLVPALSSARIDLGSDLRSSGGGPSRSGGRRALVAAQVALAVVVVATAGLLTRSLLRLQSADVGLSADRLVFLDLAIPPEKVLDRARHEQFLDELIQRLQAGPVIAAATPVNVPPFSGAGGWDVPRFTAERQAADRAAVNPSLNLESVYPNYFETFGIALVRGRAFTREDRQGGVMVAIVSADVAERTWPGEDPIGKRLKMGGPDSDDAWRTVVGVAVPTRYRDLVTPRATLYLPASQFLMTARMLVLRSAAPLDAVISLSREQVRAADPEAQVLRVAPFAELLDRPLARPRFNAVLLTVFGAAALLLAAIGLYGVVAASVRRRQREIAIRIALGATAANVRRLVLGEALALAGVGAAAGLAAATGTTRVVRSMLFDLDPLDPSTILGAALILIAASVVASYLPMRRATRFDPATALRSD
jgi:putative ABC transport system permease protein